MQRNFAASQRKSGEESTLISIFQITLNDVPGSNPGFTEHGDRVYMNNIENTQIIEPVKVADQPNAAEVLKLVYGALVEKGYDPINQIVGYIMSGDPTYITSHNNARSLIMKVERDELLEELMAAYVDSRLRKG